jgi:hypothetical protein
MPRGVRVHVLLSVDEETRTGMCRHCGPVAVRRTIPRNGGWRCMESDRGTRRVQGKFKYRLAKKDTCERCGFQAEHRCQLDVHHRDGDHDNSDPENLATICANCHRLEHLGHLDMSRIESAAERAGFS